MIKKNIILSPLGLCLTILCVSLACGLTRPLRNCDVKDILPNEKDFPEGTIINDLSSPVDGYPAESVGFTASYMQDLMFQLIARYSSDKRAGRQFTEKLDRYFEEDDYAGPWQTPLEISYRSPLAQQYHVACGNISQGYQCRMIGQYDEYYVFFFAYISDNGITLETLQDLLMKIDDHMAQCFQK